MRAVCKPQTTETKRLVLPENRDRAKPSLGPESAQPCRQGFQGGFRCYLISAAGSRCERCKKNKRRCNWDLDGAKRYGVREKEIRKLSRQERLGFAPVPREKKCHRCAWIGLACDGMRPCNRCNIETTHRSCRPQGVEHSPSCIQCRAGAASTGKSCDRGQPCKRCISKKFNCAYEAQDGLLVRTYHTPNAPLPKEFSVGLLAEEESLDEECVRCQLRKLNYDGGYPRHSCVKRQGKHTVATCNYRHTNGTNESWAVRPFQSDTSERLKLGNDYDKYTDTRRCQTRYLSVG